MAEIATSHLSGSFRLASNATVTIGGTPRTIAAGHYYLPDLLSALQTEVVAVVPGSTVKLLKNRKVHIDFNGSSTTLAIPASLAEELGFTSSPYAGATSRTAENVSRLWWSPGWPETTELSPVGLAGRKVYDRVMTSSPTGLTFDVTTHHSQTLLDMRWFAVPQDRVWTTAENPWEYASFFDQVIVQGYRFKLYSGLSATEDPNSTDEMVLPTALGPYVVPEPNYEWYQRFNQNSDALGANIEIRALKTSEYA